MRQELIKPTVHLLPELTESSKADLDLPHRYYHSLPHTSSGYRHIRELLRRSTGDAYRTQEDGRVRHSYGFKTTDGKDFKLEFILCDDGRKFLTLIAQIESVKNQTIPYYVQQIIDGLDATPTHEPEFDPNKNFEQRLMEALDMEKTIQNQTKRIEIINKHQK